MALTPVNRLKIKHAVERVLHVPGNYNGGILEMTIVFDTHLDKASALQMGTDIAGLLKCHSEIFRNVRLNTLQWISDEKFVKEISSMSLLQMGRYMDHYIQVKYEKSMDLLAGQLKKFYARSKLILLLSDGSYRQGDIERLKSNLQPFLYRKLIIFHICEKKTDGIRKTEEMEIYSGLELLNGKIE